MTTTSFAKAFANFQSRTTDRITAHNNVAELLYTLPNGVRIVATMDRVPTSTFSPVAEAPKYKHTGFAALASNDDYVVSAWRIGYQDPYSLRTPESTRRNLFKTDKGALKAVVKFAETLPVQPPAIPRPRIGSSFAPVQLSIPAEAWAQEEPGYLRATVNLTLAAGQLRNATVSMHAEAIEVELKGTVQQAVNPTYADKLDELTSYMGADSTFETLEIDGRTYVVTFAPFCD